MVGKGVIINPNRQLSLVVIMVKSVSFCGRPFYNCLHAKLSVAAGGTCPCSQLAILGFYFCSHGSVSKTLDALGYWEFNIPSLLFNNESTPQGLPYHPSNVW